jgi:DNA-binding MarR family transcriptional regulator
MAGNDSFNQSKGNSPGLTGLTVLPPLTEKQAKALEYVLDFFLKHRFYPTQREIANALGVRSTTADMYLKPLIAKGYLERVPRQRRNIRLTNDALLKLELLGVAVQKKIDAA